MDFDQTPQPPVDSDPDPDPDPSPSPPPSLPPSSPSPSPVPGIFHPVPTYLPTPASMVFTAGPILFTITHKASVPMLLPPAVCLPTLLSCD